MTGDGPKFLKYGAKIVLYKRSDLDEFALARMTVHQSTSEEAPSNKRTGK